MPHFTSGAANFCEIGWTWANAKNSYLAPGSLVDSHFLKKTTVFIATLEQFDCPDGVICTGKYLPLT